MVISKPLPRGVLASRLPSRQEAWPVFATGVFVVFSWALYRMFNEVPSWLYYLSLVKILPLVAYILSYALLESMLVLGCLLILCLICPPRWFREQFTAQGSALVLLLALGAYLIQRKVGLLLKLDLPELLAAPAVMLAGVLAATALLAWLLRRYPALKRVLENLADRMTIFGYLYVPLGLIGLVVVIFRNLF